MITFRRLLSSCCCLSAVLAWLIPPPASAQITNVVFFEDFEGTTINPAKFQAAAPFFEGGVGNIAASQHDGMVEFTGTVSQQWWAGATLQVVPTFTISPETNVVFTVDRVLEAGVGTASRSALWIMDSTQTKYILFADVRGEEGWRYNRKIGESGDVPTGGGTILTAFDGGSWDDGGWHQMKAVANGKTVSLYLDDVFGAEVKFPYSTLVFHIGSYARANNDVADTFFDNLKIETVGTTTFGTTSLTLVNGQVKSGVTVRIPPGANATTPIAIRVTSSDPSVAIPVGATAGTLTLAFAAGASNLQTFDIQCLSEGVATFTLSNDIRLAAGNTLAVAVVGGGGVKLTDNFTANTIDEAKWTVNLTGFEAAGAGTFDVVQSGGTLTISGGLDQAQYWGGASLKTVGSFSAVKDLPLVFEVDRVSIDPTTMDGLTNSTAARTGVYITTDNRSRFVFFGQNLGETGWEVNINPGNPTGSGTALAAFAALSTDTNNHRMKLVADGETVEVFLDGQSGGKFAFEVNTGIHFELGAYARALEDAVAGVFDNVKIESVLPCIRTAPQDVWTVLGDDTKRVAVTIPTMLNAAADATVTVTSSNPNVAVPEGAVGGTLTMVFTAGGPTVQDFSVKTIGSGTATFTLANPQQTCVDNAVAVTVSAPLAAQLSDDFSAATLDAAKWRTDTTPLVTGGTMTPESAVSIVDGTVLMNVTTTASDWPGFTLYATPAFSASALEPVVFDIDRVRMEYVLVGGTSSKQLTGMWVKDASTNFVFFSDFGSWDTTPGGWQYHSVIGSASDVPLTDPNVAGVYITAFNLPQFTDQLNHHMRMVADGTKVRLYLDGIRGVDVPFPFSEGLSFGVGTYVNFGNSMQNIVRGYWDNAVISKPSAAVAPTLTAVLQDGNVVITWTGTGTLESTDSLSQTPPQWADVTPAPAGNSYTVTPTAPGQKYYRVRQ